MALEDSQIGNILYQESIGSVTEPRITAIINTSSGIVTRSFIFECPQFSVSPVKWIPQTKYNYDSIENRRIVEWLGHRPYVEIVMNYAGRTKFREFLYKLGGLTQLRHTFSTTTGNITPTQRFLFSPPGDSTRPYFDVMWDSETLNFEFLGKNYIGYTNLKIKLIGQKLYPFPLLPEMATSSIVVSIGSCYACS